MARASHLCLLSVALLLISFSPLVPGASGTISIGNSLVFMVDRAPYASADVIVPGQSVSIQVMVIEDNGRSDIERVHLNLDGTSANNSITWNESADTFSTNSSSIVLNNSVDQNISSDIVAVTFGFEFSEGASALDTLGPQQRLPYLSGSGRPAGAVISAIVMLEL